jgi:glucose-1-phosphate thymidylyltransferase
MKGVVLAGGTGSRLNPLTRVTNKHLLPVYDKPMIYYPIQTLVNAGIEEILLVTGGKNAGDFLRLLGNGRDFGLKHLNYTYQEGEGGIAEALGLAEFFADDDKICVILGDNVIENNICQAVESFKKQKGGAKILLKEVSDAQRFGVAEIRGDRVIGIVEKPQVPQSNYAVVGIYLYDSTVFQKIRRLKPSGRGELEITDVNNFYIEEGNLTYETLDGWWTDAGTFESLLRANRLVAETGANKIPSAASARSAEIGARKPATGRVSPRREAAR